MSGWRMAAVAAITGADGDETTVDGIAMVIMADGIVMETISDEIVMETTVDGIVIGTTTGIVIGTTTGIVTITMVDTGVEVDDRKLLAQRLAASGSELLEAFLFPLSKKEPYVAKRCGGAEQRTIKTVQESAVSRKELGAIFDPRFALEERFCKITDRTDNANHRS